MIKIVYLLLSFILITAQSFAAKPINESFDELWAKHKNVITPGEKFTYRVSYLGITLGNVVIETLESTTLDKDQVFHIKSHLKSSKYYEFLYSLDDTLTSYISINNFLPKKFILEQIESNKTITNSLTFNHARGKAVWESFGTKKGKNINHIKKGKLPKQYHDSFSAVYFLRGLPLQVGDNYRFPVFDKHVARVANIKVEKDETLTIADKKIETVKIVASEISSKYTTKDTYINLWYSKDPSHRLIKFSASIKVGNISGELISE